jgi:hypothetical protein
MQQIPKWEVAPEPMFRGDLAVSCKKRLGITLAKPEAAN